MKQKAEIEGLLRKLTPNINNSFNCLKLDCIVYDSAINSEEDTHFKLKRFP